MVLNYLFYDKLVFGTSKNIPESYSEDDESYSKDNKSYSTHAPDAKVSVIVPIYNTAKYLPACLDSILNQTHQNLEIILVDDGSTDTSGQIADNYAKKDSRIKVIHQKNQGQSAARNTGLKKAKGEYISFIDSDDTVAETFVEKLLTPYLNNSEITLTVCGILRKFIKTQKTETLFLSPASHSKKSDTKKAYILRLLTIDGRLYSTNNKLFIADTAKKSSFDQSINFAEDTKFVLDYLKHTKSNISFILEPLYIYNFGGENSTINQSATRWENWQASYDNLKSWSGKDLSVKEQFWLKAIFLRWKVSYYRSKTRTKN